MIEFKCNECGEGMEAPDILAGDMEICPRCRTPNRVPNIVSRPATGPLTDLSQAAAPVPSRSAAPAARQQHAVRNWKPLLIGVTIVGMIGAAGLGGFVAVRLAMPSDGNQGQTESPAVAQGPAPTSPPSDPPPTLTPTPTARPTLEVTPPPTPTLTPAAKPQPEPLEEVLARIPQLDPDSPPLREKARKDWIDKNINGALVRVDGLTIESFEIFGDDVLITLIGETSQGRVSVSLVSLNANRLPASALDAKPGWRMSLTGRLLCAMESSLVGWGATLDEPYSDISFRPEE